MIRLALRLAVGGGREQFVRLAVTAFGVALGVTLLLLAAVAFPALRAHEARDAWTDTSTHNVRPAHDEAGTDALLWRELPDGYAGRDILRVDVAPLGPRAPIPPGLARLPGPGELVVSPALRRLIADTPATQLGDRYPGRIVATLGDAALRSPDSLVVFVGYDPAALRDQPGVQQVHSIEANPRTAAPTRFGRVVIGIGAAALLLPILVLIGTATRLAAARRGQRLAAMRLIGATPRQIRAIATVEAAVGALAGTVLGYAGFLLTRRYAARANIDGSAFFPSDLRLSGSSAALIGLGVPALAALAALVSLRRVQMSPLETTRQASPATASGWRLVPLAAGLTGLAVSLPTLSATPGDGALWILAAIMGLLVTGIVIAGPWLTMGVGRLLVLIARRPPTLIAGRRLADNPTGGFRAISGLVLAVFLVTLISTVTASTVRPSAGAGQILMPAGTVGTQFTDRGAAPLPPEMANALVARLGRLAGVTAVVDLRTRSAAGPFDGRSAAPVLTGCASLRAAGLGTCPDPTAVVELDARLLGSGLLTGLVTAAGTATGSLPLLGILVTTDRAPATIETVRTTIEAATAGRVASLPWTTEELKGRNRQQSDQIIRISDTILIVTLLIAGFSLAVSIAGGLVERKRPFALLRLAGMRPTELSRALVVEIAVPLVGTAVTSAALGLAVAADVIWVNHATWAPPPVGFWAVLAAGLLAALAIALVATIVPLERMTSVETARFE